MINLDYKCRLLRHARYLVKKFTTLKVHLCETNGVLCKGTCPKNSVTYLGGSVPRYLPHRHLTLRPTRVCWDRVNQSGDEMENPRPFYGGSRYIHCFI